MSSKDLHFTWGFKFQLQPGRDGPLTDSDINPLSTKLYLSGLKTQPVPRSKHSLSVIQTSQLMLDKEIIAVCSQIHTKHINTLCGQNVELYIKILSVPRSKHTPSQLYKPVS